MLYRVPLDSPFSLSEFYYFVGKRRKRLLQIANGMDKSNRGIKRKDEIFIKQRTKSSTITRWLSARRKTAERKEENCKIKSCWCENIGRVGISSGLSVFAISIPWSELIRVRWTNSLKRLSLPGAPLLRARSRIRYAQRSRVYMRNVITCVIITGNNTSFYLRISNGEVSWRATKITIILTRRQRNLHVIRSWL